MREATRTESEDRPHAEEWVASPRRKARDDHTQSVLQGQTEKKNVHQFQIWKKEEAKVQERDGNRDRRSHVSNRIKQKTS